MIEIDKYGVYHAINEGYCIWYGLPKEIFAIASINIEVSSIATSQYATKVKISLVIMNLIN